MPFDDDRSSLRRHECPLLKCRMGCASHALGFTVVNGYRLDKLRPLSGCHNRKPADSLDYLVGTELFKDHASAGLQ
jgi:hypothetical protein